MLGGDAIPMVDERGAAPGRRRAAGADERAPRADHVQAARRGGGRRAGCCELDTADPDKAARTRRARATTRSRPRALVVLRQPLDATAAREAAGAPARVIKKRGAAAAAPRRRGDPAVLDPLDDRLGARRDPATWRAFAELGRAAPASRCCSSCRCNARQRRRSQPLRGELGVRARSRSTCRSTRARTSSPRAGARRCRTAARSSSTAAIGAARVDWGAVRAAEARRHRARVRALPARRVAAADAARAAAGRRSCASNRDVARRLRAVRRAARRAAARAGSTGRRGCAIAIRARSRGLRREHARRAAARAVGAVAARPAVARARGATPAPPASS